MKSEKEPPRSATRAARGAKGSGTARRARSRSAPPAPAAAAPAPAPALDDIAARLQQLRAEILERNHLAGMDVRAAVHDLATEVEKVGEVFVERVQRDITKMPIDARLRLQVALLDATRRFVVMESVLKTALKGATRSASVVAETARLKGTLARMDARQGAEAKLKSMKAELRRLDAKTEEVLRDLERRLRQLGIRARAQHSSTRSKNSAPAAAAASAATGH